LAEQVWRNEGVGIKATEGVRGRKSSFKTTCGVIPKRGQLGLRISSSNHPVAVSLSGKITSYKLGYAKLIFPFT